MDKRSPLSWKSGPKVEAWNYAYGEPASHVKVHHRPQKYDHVSSRCHPHVNALDFPPPRPVEDYSWIRTVEPVAKSLPAEHPLSPQSLRQRERERERLAASMQGETRLSGDAPSPEGMNGSFAGSPTSGKGTSIRSSFSKENPNAAGFTTTGSRRNLKKGDGAFGEVERFTAHKAGGHYSSKAKSLLEITRKEEIELQKVRDIAEAKAQLLLSGKGSELQ